ncbi:putative oxoglutarate/iron-dependent dioxygenase, non-heme dioxygenase domain-containing protein [Medicago truncatula]|uniref:Putative oxoglutarate/iron-dependent dioxygenase, non-heme dioxygenase domain-containing protein n=1 Tax=Medicago truncatula TaxID=3880 RepID=I3SXA3_MEDTR|nr:feruloyl CoA ortho-hydroxylase F6H1-3 isoform X2 [Medicago truncatula]AFK44895.1 unknown [Medicago truncatula]RHN66661.1 putative oxoglutarate/iron-dependent dioxygenase, non-heme dioxygenase domain-containing protein [Medicago truncatula]
MSTPNNLIDFLVNQANGVKGLADLNLPNIPHQYIQPIQARLDSCKIIPHDSEEQSIPIIDFTNWDDPDVQDSIFSAATKLGFFQIVNHGIPINVLDDLKASVHKFFELPVEEKKSVKENSPPEVVRLATSFSPHAESVLEWKDYLQLVYTSEEKIHAYWPVVCKNQALEYMKYADAFIRKLLKVLLKKLNVKELDKEREYALMGAMILGFNYYPACPEPELVSGVGPHSDISSITVLLQDDIGGLYVRGKDGDSWINVPPVNGALVINIGDVLQIMSNGRYKSIEHRVVVDGNKTRISMPIFVNPAPDAVIGTLPEVLENGEEPHYKQVVFSDYFNYFFSKAHDGKKTIEFAKI